MIQYSEVLVMEQSRRSVKALRGSRRDALIAPTRRHLEPSPQANIKAYERRFGKAELAPTH